MNPAEHSSPNPNKRRRLDIVAAVNDVPALRGVIVASGGCGDGTDEVDYADDLGSTDETSGKTEIVFSVMFSDYVERVVGTGLADAIIPLLDDGDDVTSEPTASDVTVAHSAPDATVTVTYEIEDAERIPDARSSVTIPTGVVESYATDDDNAAVDNEKNAMKVHRITTK